MIVGADVQGVPRAGLAEIQVACDVVHGGAAQGGVAGAGRGLAGAVAAAATDDKVHAEQLRVVRCMSERHQGGAARGTEEGG